MSPVHNEKVSYEKLDEIAVVTIDRPEVRNAVDRDTAEALASAFRDFDADPDLKVAILTGAGGTFCAGADLKAIAGGRASSSAIPLDESLNISEDGDGPMGPTRMLLSKPVIAAVEGHAVAGGFELAIWCDLRVAARDAVFGIYCRRFGVPLIDLGTVRLPRLIGHSRALDLILTGRGVSGEEAVQVGLVNRLTEPGGALGGAIELARTIAAFPQTCMRNDRLSSYEQWDMDIASATANELTRGLQTIASGETAGGAARFAEGEGRGGTSL